MTDVAKKILVRQRVKLQTFYLQSVESVEEVSKS